MSTGHSGIEPVTAPGIHDRPPAKPPTIPMDWVRSRAEAGLFRIGATILYWIAGIEVLGGNPFGFLKIWADDLAQRADDAFNTATDAQAAAEVANVNADAADAKAQAVVDNVHQGGGGVGVGNPVDVVFSTIGNILGIGQDAGSAAADAAAQLALLQAQQGGAGGGRVIVVDFGDFTPPAVPSVLTKFYDTGASDAALTGDGKLILPDPTSGNAAGMELFLYNVEASLSNYQEVSTVMATGIESDIFGATGFNYVLLRVDATGTQFVCIQYGANTVRIGYANGGSILWPRPAIARSVPGGSILRGRAGTSGGSNVYQALIGNTVIDSWSDTGGLAAVGVNNRFIGLGFEGMSRSIGGQYTPGAISMLTGADNDPVAVVGSILQAYRNATSGVGVVTGGFGAVYDMLGTSSPDMVAAWDASTSTFTAPETREYMVSVGFCTSNGLSRGQRCQPTVLVNGTVHRRGGGLLAAVGTSNDPLPASWFLDPPHHYRLTVPVYLEAGDTLTPGLDASTARSIVGNANGDLTNLTITKG